MPAVIDQRRLLASIEKIERRAGNFAPVLPAIGNILVADAQLCFRNSANPWGEPWANLTKTTLLRRAARRTGGKPFKRGGKLKKSALKIMASAKPLLDTGLLRNSITFRVEGQGVVVGSSLKYASTHQWGALRGAFGSSGRGAIPWGNVPARSYLPVRVRGGDVDLPQETRREVVNVLSTYVFAR